MKRRVGWHQAFKRSSHHHHQQNTYITSVFYYKFCIMSQLPFLPTFLGTIVLLFHTSTAFQLHRSNQYVSVRSPVDFQVHGRTSFLVYCFLAREK